MSTTFTALDASIVIASLTAIARLWSLSALVDGRASISGAHLTWHAVLRPLGGEAGA